MNKEIETNGKYVIAKLEYGRDIYGIDSIPKLSFINGFTSRTDRTKGWAETKNRNGEDLSREYKTYTSNPLKATHLDMDDAEFACGIFNVLATQSNANYSFVVRSLSSLID